MTTPLSEPHPAKPRRRTGLMILQLAAAAIFLVAGWRSFYLVDERQVALAHTFGRPNRPVLTRAGLYWKWPWQSVTRIDRRVRLLPFESREKLTRDHEPVVLEPYACWKVSPDAVGRYVLSVGDEPTAEDLLHDLVWSALDQALADHPLTDWLCPIGDAQPTRQPPLAAILAEVTGTCQQEALTRFGIDLLDVQLRRFNRPERLKSDLVRLMQTERQRRARLRELDLAAERVRLEADARRQAARIVAEAEYQAELIHAQGEQEAQAIESEARRINPELADYLWALDEIRRVSPTGMNGPEPAQNAPPASTRSAK